VGSLDGAGVAKGVGAAGIFEGSSKNNTKEVTDRR